MPRSLNSLAIRLQLQPSDGEVVIDASDHVGGGEVSPHDGVVGDEAAVALWPGDGIAERDDAAGIAAFFGGAVHALGGAFEELAALLSGDGGMDFEVEGVLDVLVGGAEGDAEGLRRVSRCGAVRRQSRPSRSARTTQIWEKRPARASRTSAQPPGRSLQRDGSRDAVVLVVLEDVETRFGRQTTFQGSVLIADGPAVTLLVGTDAGVGGDADDGIGHECLTPFGLLRPEDDPESGEDGPTIREVCTLYGRGEVKACSGVCSVVVRGLWSPLKSTHSVRIPRTVSVRFDYELKIDTERVGVYVGVQVGVGEKIQIFNL